MFLPLFVLLLLSSFAPGVLLLALMWCEGGREGGREGMAQRGVEEKKKMSG